jgi:predicted dehydrogenase
MNPQADPSLVSSTPCTLSSRRDFARNTVLTAAGLSVARPFSKARAQAAPGNKLIVGVMGLGRGKGHVSSWLGVPGVEIAYLCDVDATRGDEAARIVQRGGQERPAKFIKDFREMLEDPNLDVISIAAPNYWHAPATILACQAGKHVYVEKPGSHNGREGELMVEAARKHDRKVQMGNQRRSFPSIIEGMAKLHAGAIGPVRSARSYYFSSRKTIGVGKPAPVPENLDYNLWQGPVPEYPYKDNLVHYNWHWHWHFGGGEMANNGIHSLDLVRWGLQAKNPEKVSFLGGRYHFQDDQETPDTGVGIFDLGGTGAHWEQSSCHQRKPEAPAFASFTGDGGAMHFSGSGYIVYDLAGKQIDAGTAPASDVPHFQNLADAIRDNAPLHSAIAEGQISTRWCHLANIALRSGLVLEIDPETGRPKAEEAMKLWSREYRAGWEPKV